MNLRGSIRARQRLECGELAPAFSQVLKRRQAGRTPNASRLPWPLGERHGYREDEYHTSRWSTGDFHEMDWPQRTQKDAKSRESRRLLEAAVTPCLSFLSIFALFCVFCGYSVLSGSWRDKWASSRR